MNSHCEGSNMDVISRGDVMSKQKVYPARLSQDHLARQPIQVTWEGPVKIHRGG